MPKKQINKKYLAIGIAIIIIISAFALSFYSKEIIERLANENVEEEKLPFYDENFGNKRITTGEDANMEPSIAINPKDENNIVVVGKDYNTESGETWVGYYTTNDGGKTWSEKLIESNILSAYYKAGDPIIDVSKDGNFYLTFKTEGKTEELIGFQKLTAVFVMKSVNKGESFSEISTVAISPDATTTHSKPYISVNEDGIIYVVWIAFNFNSNSQVWFAKSIDNGNTFIGHKVLSEISSTEKEYPGVVVKADNNKVHVSWIDTKNKELWYSYSEDQGNTFSSKKISEIEPIPYTLPNGNYRTPNIPTLTIFKETIYIAWNDYKNGDADIFIVSSKDRNTWSDALRVNKDDLKNKKDQFFPSLVSNSKYLQLIFYDRRESANNTLIKVYYAYSKDGINFTEFPLSDKDFNGDLSKSGRDNKERIGDYISLTTTEKFAIGVWCDARDSTKENPNTNLYLAKVFFD